MSCGKINPAIPIPVSVVGTFCGVFRRQALDRGAVLLGCNKIVTGHSYLSYFLIGMCGKPKFGSDSVFKNRTIQKSDICSDGFPIETACNPPFK